MKTVYVQDSEGVWHIKGVHTLGLVRVHEKDQLHFPKGVHCPECRKFVSVLTLGIKEGLQ